MHTHFESRNISFLKMAIILKELGIDNYTFLLALHNKDLEYVDPHDPNLTTIQKNAIILECTMNPWYFFREVARVREAGEVKPIEMFPINRGTLAILYTVLNSIDHIVRLPKQHYRETTYKYLFTYLFLFGENKNKINMFNIHSYYNQDMIDFIRDTILDLPKYFETSTKFVDNLNEFKNQRIDSSITKMRIPKTQREADITARGLTGNMAYYHLADENKYMETLFNASFPALCRSRKNNYEKGSNRINSIMISSSITDDSESSRFIDHRILHALRWEDRFYDLDIQDLHEYISNNAGFRFVYIEYDFLQLGKTQEWFDQQCKMMNMDEGKINRELLLKR
jgi:hypothetical protein